MMGNFGSLFGQIQQMQEELSRKIVEGISASGAVRVCLNGRQQVVEVSVNPDVVNGLEVDSLEEMIGEAVNDALEKYKTMIKEEFSRITGLNLPSIPGLF